MVAAFVRDDVSKGPDGRLRFSFSPGAVVVAWSEMALPAPPIAQVPTLVIRPEVPLFPGSGPGPPLSREPSVICSPRQPSPTATMCSGSPRGRRSVRSRTSWAPRPELAFARLAEAGFADAEVGAVAAVELVAAGAAVEAVVAAFAVAAVLAAAHQAGVVARAAPAAIAAVAGLAVVVAATADAVGVDRGRDADVVAAFADAAVARGPLRIAGVRLGVADQLVRAVSQVGG